ncbi:ABC transporter substrate-binding protein [Nodosilinea nodulosa]|uniref:ABC transporter substrate-binding protein n=1 Tax=Nodosilinea nodulosa TaxID=416001 RepID=UPI00030D9831|nr:ABC transporter substrate-binding protein [Nodosilinea nodulosa]
MKRRTFLPTLLAFFCTLLITVSCAQNAPQADAPAEPAPATATAGEPVKMGYSNWAGWWPWAVAEAEGLFEKNGANVELIWFDGYLESIQALAGGQLDANGQTLNDTISFLADAANGMVTVLVNDNSAGNDKIIVADGIDSVADLKGKTVALEEGVVDDFLLTLALEDAGMKRDDVEIKNLETGAAATAFAAGQTDGFGGWVPFWETALSREGSKEIITSKDYPGAIPDLLVVSQKLIDERPEQVQALVDTWFDTLAFIKANPDRANEIMAKRASVSDTEFEKYTEGTKIFTLEENLEAFQAGGDDMKYMPYAAQKMTDFMVKVGFIPQAPDLSKLLDDQFVKAYAAKK